MMMDNELVAAYGADMIYFLALVALLAFNAAIAYLLTKEMKGYNRALIDHLKEKV